MSRRRDERQRKLWQPVVEKFENIIRDDLADLRSMVSREYCSIIAGISDMKRFHHLNNKMHISLSDRDRKFFETLTSMAARVTWIALQRKNFTIIGEAREQVLILQFFLVMFQTSN